MLIQNTISIRPSEQKYVSLGLSTYDHAGPLDLLQS